ncbi:MAG TPA: hypothetical protein PLL78_10650 [Fimbriimonadaceae bacterium]|nr:hypothetical protein [Fimbriimonadaceae bacterium]HRJ97134.1 hypothetical protein [Fimbriimonadaceae bacterium]
MATPIPRRTTIINLAIGCAISLITVQGSYSLDNDLEVALGTASLSTRTARFDPGTLRFFQQGEFRTPFFETCFENPWRMPFTVDMWRKQFAVTGGRPSESLGTAGRMLGRGSRRTLLGNPIQAADTAARQPGSLRAVLDSLRGRGVLRGEIPDLSKVPGEVQSAAALVLQVMIDMLPHRRAAITGVADLPQAFQRVIGSDPASDDPAAVQQEHALFQALDINYLLVAGHDLTLAAQSALSLLGTNLAETSYDVTIQTDWGAIVLTGGSDTKHPDRPTLLVIDTGGNDTYLNGPSNHSVNNWASVVIDTAGNDKYLSDAALDATPIEKFEGRTRKGRFGPGSACFGVTVLLDAAGDDLYRSHRPGIGSATIGCAVVYDREGDDRYDVYADSLGYGKFGLSLVEDGAGKDSYAGFSQVQGCGQTGGLGMLIDRTGNDTYVANDTLLDFVSPQSKDHNANMSQGCGNGRRADYLDGHSLSGGIGILYDVEGDDSYTCGVFGQGCGYWEGVGMLWDTAGSDRYSGQWYVQGAAAHFAIGYLEDEAGDDRYSAPMNMAMGAGHDFSIGMLVDRGGGDEYKAPNLSLGAGNANGIGFFLDLSGVDRYESSGITLGKGAEAPKGTLRERALCLGVFMDLGGIDTYPQSTPWAKNQSRITNWTDRGPSSAESQLGIFWDR